MVNCSEIRNNSLLHFQHRQAEVVDVYVDRQQNQNGGVGCKHAVKTETSTIDGYSITGDESSKFIFILFTPTDNEIYVDHGVVRPVNFISIDILTTLPRSPR